MGLFSLMNNKKRTMHQRKSHKVHRMKKAEKKKRHGHMEGEIADPELQTVHQLRKRRTSPRANITLSGKKKRKLLRQMKRMQAEQSQMEVVTEVKKRTTAEPKSGKKKTKADKNVEETTDTGAATEDVEMGEES